MVDGRHGMQQCVQHRQQTVCNVDPRCAPMSARSYNIYRARPNRALAVVGYSSDVETREELDAAPRSFVPNGTVRFDFPRATDDSLDSIRAIVGWTLGTVLAFWTPVAVVAYVLTS